jgi:O-antigen/teichoic acid export membrane protein
MMLATGSVLVAVLTFGYILVVGRSMPPAAFADFTAAYSFFTFAAVAISPIAPMTARAFARLRVRGETTQILDMHRRLRRVLTRSVVIAGIVLGPIVLPLSSALHFRSPFILLLALASSLLFTMVNFERGVLQGSGNLGGFTMNTIVEAVLRLALVAAVLVMSGTPTLLFGAHTAAMLVAALALSRHTQPPSASIAAEPPDWSEFQRTAAPMFVAMLGMAVFQNIDVFLVKRTFSAEDAGLYGAGSVLGRSLGVLAVAIYVLAGPALTEVRERGGALPRATLRLAAMFVAIASVPWAVLVFAGERVTTLVYGTAFAAAGPMAGHLATVSVLTSLHLIVGQGLITLRSRWFVPLYLAGAVAQMLGLVFVRTSIQAMIQVQYVVQGGLTALLIVVLMLARPERD